MKAKRYSIPLERNTSRVMCLEDVGDTALTFSEYYLKNGEWQKFHFKRKLHNGLKTWFSFNDKEFVNLLGGLCFALNIPSDQLKDHVGTWFTFETSLNRKCERYIKGDCIEVFDWDWEDDLYKTRNTLTRRRDRLIYLLPLIEAQIRTPKEQSPFTTSFRNLDVKSVKQRIKALREWGEANTPLSFTGLYYKNTIDESLYLLQIFNGKVNDYLGRHKPHHTESSLRRDFIGKYIGRLDSQIDWLDKEIEEQSHSHQLASLENLLLKT